MDMILDNVFQNRFPKFREHMLLVHIEIAS